MCVENNDYAALSIGGFFPQSGTVAVFLMYFLLQITCGYIYIYTHRDLQEYCLYNF